MLSLPNNFPGDVGLPRLAAESSFSRRCRVMKAVYLPAGRHRFLSEEVGHLHLSAFAANGLAPRTPPVRIIINAWVLNTGPTQVNGGVHCPWQCQSWTLSLWVVFFFLSQSQSICTDRTWHPIIHSETLQRDSSVKINRCCRQTKDIWDAKELPRPVPTRRECTMVQRFA